MKVELGNDDLNGRMACFNWCVFSVLRVELQFKLYPIPHISDLELKNFSLCFHRHCEGLGWSSVYIFIWDCFFFLESSLFLNCLFLSPFDFWGLPLFHFFHLSWIVLDVSQCLANLNWLLFLAFDYILFERVPESDLLIGSLKCHAAIFDKLLRLWMSKLLRLSMPLCMSKLLWMSWMLCCAFAI